MGTDSVVAGSGEVRYWLRNGCDCGRADTGVAGRIGEGLG